MSRLLFVFVWWLAVVSIQAQEIRRVLGVGQLPSGSFGLLEVDTAGRLLTSGGFIAQAGSGSSIQQMSLMGVDSSGVSHVIKLNSDGSLNVGGGGSVLLTQPTIRGSSVQSAGSTSFTVTWPVGTIAGDETFIFAGSTATQNIPTGWSTIFNVNGGSFNGTVLHKILNAADITAGSVVVTNGLAIGDVVASVTLVGKSSGVRAEASSAVAGSASPKTVDVYAGVQPTDLVLLFTGGNLTSIPSCDLGVSLHSASAANLYSYTAPSAGEIFPTFTFAPGTQSYVSVLVLKGT